MQTELEKGASLDEIRKKITKGEIQTKVTKQQHHKKSFSAGRIQRKKRDLMQLITKYAAETIEEQDLFKPKGLTGVEIFAKTKEEQDRGQVLNKKIYKLADKELLVRKYLPLMLFSSNFLIFLPLWGFSNFLIPYVLSRYSSPNLRTKQRFIWPRISKNQLPFTGVYPSKDLESGW